MAMIEGGAWGTSGTVTSPRPGDSEGGGGPQGTESTEMSLEAIWIEMLLKMVVRGSDGLVLDLYRRLRPDPGTTSPLVAGERLMKNWRRIAATAVVEGALTRAEARRFLRSVAASPGI